MVSTFSNVFTNVKLEGTVSMPVPASLIVLPDTVPVKQPNLIPTLTFVTLLDCIVAPFANRSMPYRLFQMTFDVTTFPPLPTSIPTCASVSVLPVTEADDPFG